MGLHPPRQPNSIDWSIDRSIVVNRHQRRRLDRLLTADRLAEAAAEWCSGSAWCRFFIRPSPSCSFVRQEIFVALCVSCVAAVLRSSTAMNDVAIGYRSVNQALSPVLLRIRNGCEQWSLTGHSIGNGPVSCSGQRLCALPACLPGRLLFP
ncbi:unnamed protein product [Soboliphyme baturini]|uniref:Transposase n=1 Tax=Soboliphyme baturini TaxID=241478 RepID=A0A183IZS7_9BILA|nr:unnamed protein product [Soboliphyme baturini]